MALAVYMLRAALGSLTDMHSAWLSSAKTPFLASLPLNFLPAFIWFNVAVCGGFAAQSVTLRAWPSSTAHSALGQSVEVPETPKQFRMGRWLQRTACVASSAVPSYFVYSEAFWLTNSVVSGCFYQITWVAFGAVALAVVITAELSVLFTCATDTSHVHAIA